MKQSFFFFVTVGEKNIWDELRVAVSIQSADIVDELKRPLSLCHWNIKFLL